MFLNFLSIISDFASTPSLHIANSSVTYIIVPNDAIIMRSRKYYYRVPLISHIYATNTQPQTKCNLFALFCRMYIKHIA